MWLGRLWSCDLGGQECPFPQVTYRGRGRPRHIFDTRSSLPRGSAQETKSGRPAQGLSHLGNLSSRADVGAVWANADEGAHATGSVTGKRRGEIAEAKFLAKASELGFGVAKPWGDSDAYDFIVQTGGRLWKVQVKSAHVAWKDGSYSFRAHGHSYKAYRADEIDLLVAYVVPENAWYV